MGELWFVTGGARSGKSAFAERLAAAAGRHVTYVATLEPLDDEMTRRVARHRAERPPAWDTVEEPRALAATLRAVQASSCVVIDCLSLWLTNRLLDELGETPDPLDGERVEHALAAELSAVLAEVARREGPSVIVSNEVGSGIVPATPLGRVYRDLLGRANQVVAREAGRVWLVVAGRALELPPGEPNATHPASRP